MAEPWFDASDVNPATRIQEIASPAPTPAAKPADSRISDAFGAAVVPPAEHIEKLFTQAGGEPLPTNAPVDDRVDSAMTVRENDYKQAGDLDWLLKSTEDPEKPPTWLTPAAERFANKPGAKTTAGRVAGDIGMGLIEAPGQAAGGARDAVQNTIDLGETLDNLVSLGGFIRANPSDKPNPNAPPPGQPGSVAYEAARRMRLGRVTYAPPAKWQELIKSGAVTEPDLPQPPGGHPPQTVTGGVVRGLAQFLTGFYLAGKALGGTTGASAAGTIARTTGVSAAADFSAFAPDQPRLSDLIENTPLANPITQYLKSDPNDSDAEGRFKNTLEGLVTNTAAALIAKGFKAYKATWATAKGAKTAEQATERVANVFRYADENVAMQHAADMGLIGNAEMPLTARIGAKIKTAMTDTELGVPDEVGAKALNNPVTGGLTPIDQAGETYVNFARINAPEDVQRVIDDTASAFKESIDKNRRGVRTNAQTVLSAQDENAWKTLMTRRVGQPLNAEQSVAARQLWISSGDKLSQVAREAANSPSPENLFQFRRMMAVHQAIQKEVIGARTETARALQSWAIPVGSNSARLTEMAAAIEGAGGTNQSVDIARKIAVLASQPGGRGQFDQFVEKTFAQKVFGSIQEYWMNSLLSNPKTHVRNVTSNALVMGIDPIERATASKIGWLLTDEPDAIKAGEAMQQVYGMIGSIGDAFDNAVKAITTNQSGYGIGKVELPRERYITGGAWGAREGSFAGRAIDGLGAVVNAPGKLLMAEDEFFKTLNYRGELRALAMRQATEEGASDIASRITQILSDVPEAMHEEAKAGALYRTFQTPPGPFVRAVNRFRTNYPILRYVIPFVNTPANIFKYTVDRTPLAVVTNRYKEAVAAGGARAAMAKTRIALGSSAMLYAMDLAFNGHITGSGPKDNPTEMSNWRRQGYAPYAVKVGNSWVNYNRLDPLGYHLGIGADLAEYVMNSDSQDFSAEWDEMFGAAVFGVSENILSKGYMEGLSMVIEASRDPSGPVAMNYVKQLAQSFVPAVAGEIARQMDPVQREANNVVTGIKQRLPGYSATLPARVDFWGREVRYQSGLGPAFDRFSPLYGSEYHPEPIDKFMDHDGWYVGETTNFQIDGETVGLRNMPRVKTRYYQLRGMTKPSEMGPTNKAEGLIDRYGNRSLLTVLNDVVTNKDDLSPQFRELEGPDDRHDFIQKIISRYGAAAKETLFSEFPELKETSGRKAAYRRSRSQLPDMLPAQ